MDIDIEKKRSKGKNMPDDAYPMVRENDTCPHWEYRGDERLSPMRECWYCKFSDFRKDLSEQLTNSLCRYQINQSDMKKKV